MDQRQQTTLGSSTMTTSTTLPETPDIAELTQDLIDHFEGLTGKQITRRLGTAIYVMARWHMCFPKTPAKAWRKYPDTEGNFTPYPFHPTEVAAAVANAGFDEDEVIAALFHDLFEDTLMGYWMMHGYWGAGIANRVWELTDQCHEGNRATRKRDEAARLGACTYEAQSIKCADIDNNTASIVEQDPRFAVVYLAEKEHLLAQLTNAHEGLHAGAVRSLLNGLNRIDTPLAG